MNPLNDDGTQNSKNILIAIIIIFRVVFLLDYNVKL